MEDFLEQLNESQREAVLYNEGPSLVIAGAGSGKTRVLTYKIAWLLKQGISPYTILALTFTNKAAREMKSRIAQITDEETARRLWMGTFHSIFSRILRREAEKTGFRSDFTIYDAQDSKNLIRAIIKEKELDDKVYKPSAVQDRISKAKNALITPQAYEKDYELMGYDRHTKRPRIAEIYAEYQNRLRTAQVMDFDDLLLQTYSLFKNNAEVLERYQNLFRFILVDEYQDTNSVQHEIVRLLADTHHRVCVVGDDAQSIYSFRGANIGNILNFRKTYPESKLFKLEQNYRSSQTIVNAANSLIKKNKQQIAKTVYSEKEVGEKIQVINAYTDFEEGYSVASRIAEMRMLHKYDYNSFAILYRTNAQSRIFEEALRKINIPYRIYGGLSFYQRKEVKDVIAYLRLVTNPNDEEALKRVINYPARGIGKTTLDKITAKASALGVSLWEVLSNPPEYNVNINSGTAKKLASFRELIEGFIAMNETANAYELGSALIRATGLSKELYDDKTPEGLSRVQNVEELLNSLYSFVSDRMEEGDDRIKTGDFLAEISLLTDQDTNNTDQTDFVTMMTVHSAKGLEFPNVFVVGLEENLFPSQLSLNNPKELEEERRLFYVAITRAEENCVLTYANSRFRHGKSEFGRPSRFIRDIDEQYLSSSRLSATAPAADLFIPPRPTAAPLRKLTALDNTDEVPAREQIGELKVGDSILHERFGKGKIINLMGDDESAKATVEFETVGTKQLLLKFAKFKLIR
jgi:Superfamily I DNA and RNA helicases